MKHRVVVTGVGLVSPLGKTTDATWEAMVAGKSGAARIERFDPTEFDVRFACEVNDFDPTDYMDRKEAKRADRFAQFGIAAAEMAVSHAGWDRSPATSPAVSMSREAVSRINSIDTRVAHTCASDDERVKRSAGAESLAEAQGITL